MSNNLLSLNRTPAESEPHPSSAEPEEQYERTITDCTDAPPRGGRLALAARKLWRAIKHPKVVFAKRRNGTKRLLALISRHSKQPPTRREGPRSSPEAISNPQSPVPRNRSTTVVAEVLVSETFTGPDPRSAVTATTDSSISLSAESGAIPNPTPALDPRDSLNMVNSIDHQFGSSDRPSTNFSEATTARNSTTSNVDNLSNHASGVRSVLLSESNGGLAIGGSIDASPFNPVQLITPFMPRLQTNLGVPGADEEDYPSVHERTSSPASAVEFLEIGGHFNS